MIFEDEIMTSEEWDDFLAHYGMPRRSGRYPYGSGEDPYQHGNGDLVARVRELKLQGKTEKQIADELEMSTGDLRTQLRIARDERRMYDIAKAEALRAKGYSLKQIAEEMGFANDSSVRSLLDPIAKERTMKARETADFLKSKVGELGMIDVGKEVERQLNVSREKLDEALKILELEGYPTWSGRIAQMTNRDGQKTTLSVLCPPGTEHKEIFKSLDDIHSLEEWTSDDDGATFRKSFVYPESLDSKRLQILYDEDGGTAKDGVIELRRGVADLDLGDGAHYAQVRIMVDDKYYLKGMAVYGDDLPDGVDVRFNSNKPKEKGMANALKAITEDPDNPFGSTIKENGGQTYYTDENGEKKLSLINKRAEEGDWGDWADKLPSQFLSKQPMKLINRQLGIAKDDARAELDDILAIDNPVVKKSLLQAYAEGCDSASVHLQAAALPRQKYQVLLPLTSLKDNEVYAPNYDDGETVALVRYPHGGTFEIPILTVNNQNAEGKRVITPSAADAIGINKRVADRLSGADFDGDTAMVIPIGGDISIKSTRELPGLKGFDPKLRYAYSDDDISSGKAHIMSKQYTQKQMGIVSNLINDMTLKRASEDEIAAAVRHSMVVIDANKHKLNYKQSEIDNNIKALRKKYQGHIDPMDGRYHEGASTLLSLAKSPVDILRRRGNGIIDPETGELSYKSTDKPTIEKRIRNSKGEWVTVTSPNIQSVPRMSLVKDAHALSTGRPQEEAYADFANEMKALANRARKEMVSTGDIAYNKHSAEVYAKEVSSLMSQLNDAKKNAPRERMAQMRANAAVKERMKAYDDLDKSAFLKMRKKVSQQELTKARQKVGAHSVKIWITDKEWKAIQSGAIKKTTLSEIISKADSDRVKELAMPKNKNGISDYKAGRIKNLSAMGYTNAQIADYLDVSVSSVTKTLDSRGGESSGN